MDTIIVAGSCVAAFGLALVAIDWTVRRRKKKQKESDQTRLSPKKEDRGHNRKRQRTQ